MRKTSTTMLSIRCRRVSPTVATAVPDLDAPFPYAVGMQRSSCRPNRGITCLDAAGLTVGPAGAGVGLLLAGDSS
jgi:hypothetical protein